MGLSIAMADLACFYADLANNFLNSHGLFQSVKTKEEMSKIRQGLQDFRNFYNDLTEKQMRIQNFNLFDGLEQSITKSFFEDREMVYYKKYNKWSTFIYYRNKMPKNLWYYQILFFKKTFNKYKERV